MSERATQLFELADRQISDVLTVISTVSDGILRRPCPSRERLGDGTVAAVALHTADTYRRIAGFAHGHSETAHTGAAGHDDRHDAETVGPSELIERLSNSRQALSVLAELTDEQLDAVPPVGRARFCDGQRTLEQVLASMLKHQGHQIQALRAATP